MERAITGFHRDDAGHWVAELECGHVRHDRHDPPLVARPWVQSEAGRLAALGRELECLRCDRREWPEGYEPYRRTPLFDADTLPEGLRTSHSTKNGIWARIHVVSGRLRYEVHGLAGDEETLLPGRVGIVVPEVEHAISPLGPVRLYLEFHRARSGPARPPEHLRGVTVEWLGDLLGHALRTASFRAIGVFSSELWRIRLAYAETTPAAPQSLILKCPKSIDGERHSQGFQEESAFYAELASRITAQIPHAWYVGPEPISHIPIIVLEDLQDLEPISFLEGASNEHARLGLAALAELHASWWSRVEDIDWIPHLAQVDYREQIADRFESAWSSMGGLLRERYGEGVGMLGDALMGHVAASLAPLGETATLLHGDPHFENCPLMLRKSGGRGAVLLDWASVARGHAALDVAVFIVMSLPIEARRRQEASLVEHHAATAGRAGVKGWADPWHDYRLGVLRRFVLMVDLAAGHTASALEQWDAGSGVVERCLQAAIDLDCAELVA